MVMADEQVKNTINCIQNTNQNKTINGKCIKENDSITVYAVLSSKCGVVHFDDQVVFDLGYSCEAGLSPLFDSLVSHMSLHQQSTFSVKQDTVSSMDNPLSCLEGLESDSSDALSLQLTVVQINKPKKFWEMNEDQKIALSEKMKTRGNRAFQNNKLSSAYRCYRLMIRSLEGSVSLDDPTSPATSLLLAGYLNAGQCLLKAQRWLECIHICDRALKLSPGNIKALYRRAKAFFGFGDLEQALNGFKVCLDREPTSALFRKDLEEVQKRICQIKRDDNAIYRRMFNMFGDGGALSSPDFATYPIGAWSNSMADEMISLSEELEAFGETMPEPRSRTGLRQPAGPSSHKLDRIPDIGEEECCGEDDDEDELDVSKESD